MIENLKKKKTTFLGQEIRYELDIGIVIHKYS